MTYTFFSYFTSNWATWFLCIIYVGCVTLIKSKHLALTSANSSHMFLGMEFADGIVVISCFSSQPITTPFLFCHFLFQKAAVTAKTEVDVNPLFTVWRKPAHPSCVFSLGLNIRLVSPPPIHTGHHSPITCELQPQTVKKKIRFWLFRTQNRWLRSSYSCLMPVHSLAHGRWQPPHWSRYVMFMFNYWPKMRESSAHTYPRAFMTGIIYLSTCTIIPGGKLQSTTLRWSHDTTTPAYTPYSWPIGWCCLLTAAAIYQARAMTRWGLLNPPYSSSSHNPFSLAIVLHRGRGYAPWLVVIKDFGKNVEP